MGRKKGKNRDGGKLVGARHSSSNNATTGSSVSSPSPPAPLPFPPPLLLRPKTILMDLRVLVVVVAAVVAYYYSNRYWNPTTNNDMLQFEPADTDAKDAAAATATDDTDNTIMMYDRLFQDWPVDKLTVRGVDGDDSRGVYATMDINRGDVIAATDFSLPGRESLEVQAEKNYPQLRELVEAALTRRDEQQQLVVGDRPRVEQVLGAVQGLLMWQEMEETMGNSSSSTTYGDDNSPWYSYFATLPSNASNTAFYWTEEELKCTVPRPLDGSNPTQMRRQIHNFRQVYRELSDTFPPLQKLQSSSSGLQRAEYLYVMYRTRSFGGKGRLYPVFDMFNHDPTRAAPVIITVDTDVGYSVATQNIKAGEQVFNNYGPLTPIQTAERYGFVDPDPAYVGLDSIVEDMIRSPYTKNESLCINGMMGLYGKVKEKRIEAQFWGGAGFSHREYFKAFRPTEITNACVRAALQSQDDKAVATYISEKIQRDLPAYQNMANADHCQSLEGNYPLIRMANRATAQLLTGALEVAEAAERGEIAYPDFPHL